MRFSWTAFLFLSSLSHAGTYRDDLGKAAAVFCGESKASLSSLGVYDAQIELAMVKEVKEPKAFAHDFAEANGHRGYGYGSCKDGRRWILSVPAPAPVLKGLELDQQAMRPFCESLDVDAVVEGQDQPMALAQGQKPGVAALRLDLPSKTITSLAVTCHPFDPRTQGPELWALKTSGQQARLPKMKDMEAFMNWLAGKRLSLGLPSLARASAPLQVLADAAARQRDLHHPRALLLSEKARLKTLNIQLLGENRASSSTYEGLVALLWNSPQHRRLLLNPKANALAYNLSAKNGEKLLVLVLAAE